MVLSGPDPQGVHVEVLTGTRAILARLPSLRRAAEAWTQAGELAELPYLLSVPVFPRREPLLLLLHTFATDDDDLLGAVLVFAYGAGLFGRRLLSHPDRTGRRCVFGPAADRSRIAASAARTLLHRGASLVVLPYRAGSETTAHEPASELLDALRVQNALCTLTMMGLSSKVEWQLQAAARPLELPLEPTLDATLTRMGKRTRRNLRAATRLCERELGARLDWDPGVSEQDMQRFNAISTHRVRPGVVTWRYSVWREDPQAFVAGVRSAEGEWLALAGGRQTEDGVTLDWQMNRKFPRFSISLVMRGYLMARFGAKGLTCMRFEGGTTHALARGFRRGAVYILRARKAPLWLHLVKWVMVTLLPSRAITHDLFSGQAHVTASTRRASPNPARADARAG